MQKALDLHHALPTSRQMTDAEHARCAERNADRESLTSDNWPFKVARFTKLYTPQHIHSQPRLPSGGELDTYIKMDESERVELVDAVGSNNLAEVLDAVLDSIYVKLNFLIKLGYSSQVLTLAMEEIHASNMTKTDEEGNPLINRCKHPSCDITLATGDPYACQEPFHLISHQEPVGKVLKGANYVRADLSHLI